MLKRAHNVFIAQQMVFLKVKRKVVYMPQTKRIIRCPKCGFTFDITYGRTFACSGCPSLVHCDMAKCPKCGHEFPLPAPYGGAYPSLYRKYT